MTLYFEQTKPDKNGELKRYKVVSFDEEKGTVTLKGPDGHPFTDTMDKPRFKKMGYKLVKVADDE